MKTKGFVVKAAGATSLALLLTTSAFAEARPQDQTYRDNDRYRGQRNEARTNNNYRENDRVNVQGRITSFRRENNGYRVNLDRGQGFWVPDSYYRAHARDWRVGLSINIGGVFRGGSIVVGDYPVYAPAPVAVYDSGYVRGIVDSVDYRRGTVWMRDDRSGRVIEVDMRTDRYGRLNMDEVRRGDFIELSGAWLRGNVFAAQRINSIRSGRY